MEVTRAKTPLTEFEVAEALQKTFVEAPTLEILGVGWAQIALENAHGDAIWCNNIAQTFTKLYNRFRNEIAPNLETPPEGDDEPSA